MTPTYRKTSLLTTIIVLLALLLGVGIYFYIKLDQEKTSLSLDLQATTDQLAQAQKEKTDFNKALQEAANKNKTFADQLTQATQSLDKLTWLNTIDPQLIQKYSKVYFLNEHYVPRSLSPIDSKFLANTNRSLEIEDRVLPFLQKMLQAAALDNITIQVDSAYRSFQTQGSLKSSYKVTYGSGANTFSAEQGYSEHQLGTALDFTTPSLNGGLTGFQKTSAYTWMKDNAYKYGFSISYPSNNKYYVFEPWHWRFVGIDLATKLHNDNKYFYDLDQREINTYLPVLFNTEASSSFPQPAIQ